MAARARQLGLGRLDIGLFWLPLFDCCVSLLREKRELVISLPAVLSAEALAEAEALA
jgi:hypothetical protein